MQPSIIFSYGFKQRKRSHNITMHKRRRVPQRSINVGFRREMHHNVRSFY